MKVIIIKCHQNIVIRGHSIQISPIILDPRTEGRNGLYAVVALRIYLKDGFSSSN